MRALRWICGVKPKPKAGNKPLHHFILHGLDKPGSSATVSDLVEKGLLTLSRVQFVPALLNCLGDQSGSIEARYGFHSQRIGEG